MTEIPDSVFLRGVARDYEGHAGFYPTGERLNAIARALALVEAEADATRVRGEVTDFLRRMSLMWTDEDAAAAMIAGLSAVAHAKLAYMNVLRPRVP